ncbi:MAG TPA: ribose-phosphate diphosphokinase, partial [Bacteroidia bacterium]|nr:ribose-phosphate diphosphokinase [Bacteroidia bacterium]
MEQKVKILSGSATRYLTEKIAAAYGQPLGDVVFNRFSDGEFQTSIEETVRGTDLFIVQSTFPPTDNLFELLLMVDAAKRASAKQIVAVIPYFGWARQDRKDRPRVAIGAKLVADMLATAGVTRVVTMDLHADQIQGFFNVPVDHLYASSIFLPYIQKLNLPDLTIAAPDMGGSKRANAYSKYLKSEIV